jgi:hypothetical protein
MLEQNAPCWSRTRRPSSCGASASRAPRPSSTRRSAGKPLTTYKEILPDVIRTAILSDKPTGEFLRRFENSMSPIAP